MQPKLKEVVIEITSQCNLNCRHCGSDCTGKLSDQELSLKEWKGCVDQIVELKAEKIVFSGGEPTLKKGFSELLAYTAEKGIKFGFITNGFHFPKSLIGIIGNKKPFAVGVSIDGLKSTHNSIRRNDKSWTNLWKNISQLKDLGIQVCAVTTINRTNYPDLPRLAEFFSLAEIDSWQLQLAMPVGRMSNQRDLLIDSEVFKTVCLQIISFRKKYPEMNILAADCFGADLGAMIRPNAGGGCSAGISTFGIDAFGNVLPCLSMRTSKSCGNIRQKSLSEIWKASDGFDFNRRFNPENTEGSKCVTCELFLECKGGCNSQSLAYYGHLYDSPFCFFRSFSIQKEEREKNEKLSRTA